MTDLVGKKRKGTPLSLSKERKKKKKDDNKNFKSMDKVNNIKFMAKIKKNKETEDTSKTIDEIFKGDFLNFRKRRETSLENLSQLKNDLNKKKNDEIISEIEKCIKYDNTNKTIIYECLKIYSEHGLKDNFNELLNQSKFCLTKNFNVIDINNKSENLNIKLSDNFINNSDIILFENDMEIIGKLKLAFESLKKVCNSYKNIRKEKKMKYQIKRILTFNLKKDKEEKYYIYHKKSKNEILSEFYTDIMKFLENYIHIKKFDYYLPNQPINYKINQTLYLFHIFYKLYENVVIVNNKKKQLQIILNNKKLEIIGSMTKYVENLIKELDENDGNISEGLEKKIRFFFFCLKIEPSKSKLDNLQSNIDNMLIQQKVLNEEKIKNFISDNKIFGSYFEIEKGNFFFYDNNKKYVFNYKQYNERLLGEIINNINDKIILKRICYDPLNYYNFFDNEDLKYMRDLTTKILKSKLFNEIWSNYSDVKNRVEYYFNNDKNIEDLIDNIDYYPFDESSFGLQGMTFHNELKIIVSGLHTCQIKTDYDFKIYKILEVSRKMIIILHEICHFIKRALNLLTEGEILNTTIESIQDDPDVIESGRIFETLIFNLKNPNSQKNKNQKNEINLVQSLNILNPDIYENGISSFKRNLNKLCPKKKMNQALSNYIKKIGFNIDDFYKNKKSYKDYSIDISRKANDNFTITYKSDNHNI